MMALRLSLLALPALILGLMASGMPAGAADLPAKKRDQSGDAPFADTRPLPDQGPDADGRGLGAWRRREAAGGRYALECPEGLWRPPYGLIVPTNAPCDPTYVGSSFGLNQPSAFGTLPPPGEGAP